jgi:hypothetical protein
MTRKLLAILATFALVVMGLTLATPAKAQQGPARVNGPSGTYFASAYNQWSSTVAIGFTGTGSQTMSMLYGYVTLPDGRPFVPFSTNVPLQVDFGSNAEVVTPSAVSGCQPLNPNQGVCQVTATFANAHGNGTFVSSGDFGIEEAILDAQNNGGGLVYFAVDLGNVTLSTSGVTTTSTVKLPSHFIVEGASARVNTTITVATSWNLGIVGSTAAFVTTDTGLTAGSTARGFETASAIVNLAAETTLAAVVFTAAGGTPGAGAIHAKVWGYVPVQPVS